MPGYTGHTPKVVPTELGLGARYHETSRKGFAAFKDDYLKNKEYVANQSPNFVDNIV
jgi:hypothetical protein